MIFNRAVGSACTFAEFGLCPCEVQRNRCDFAAICLISWLIFGRNICSRTIDKSRLSATLIPAGQPVVFFGAGLKDSL
jgi:hypothetical protein